MTRNVRPETAALHADHGLERAADVAPPLHLSTTFEAGNPEGLVYARNAQPTRQRLEAVLGALEGGEAVTYASGQAATTAALLHLRPRRVLMARGGYHGTHQAVDALAALGLFARAPLSDPPREGDLLWVETPKNPTCEIEDVAAHAARAHAAGARVVVDSTFATPMLQHPLALGADVVMHSMTKFIAGHSDALGGVLCVASREEAERLRAARTTFGAVPGALETWLALRGVRTLAVRVRQATETATRLAAWLAPRVARVWHPSLPGHPGFEVAR
ncbi:MAG TPA: PLP-dependent transferase, partial [Anaeromyxobacteraceae bacterium]|nr:PLP-dependent transferase [Anaeromyxobacteraceae bacterium]